jgi:hypothetical protein
MRGKEFPKRGKRIPEEGKKISFSFQKRFPSPSKKDFAIIWEFPK